MPGEWTGSARSQAEGLVPPWPSLHGPPGLPPSMAAGPSVSLPRDPGGGHDTTSVVTEVLWTQGRGGRPTTVSPSVGAWRTEGLGAAHGGAPASHSPGPGFRPQHHGKKRSAGDGRIMLGLEATVLSIFGKALSRTRSPAWSQGSTPVAPFL